MPRKPPAETPASKPTARGGAARPSRAAQPAGAAEPAGPDAGVEANGEEPEDQVDEPEADVEVVDEDDEAVEVVVDDDDAVEVVVDDDADDDDDDDDDEEEAEVIAPPVVAARPARPAPGRPPGAKEEPDPPFFLGERVRLVSNLRPRTNAPIGSYPVGAEGRVETVLSLTAIVRFDQAPDTKEVVAFPNLQSLDEDAMQRRAERDRLKAAEREAADR